MGSPSVLEPCPHCRRLAVLLPVRGRRGGERLCFDCGADWRATPRLFDDDEIDTEASR